MKGDDKSKEGISKVPECSVVDNVRYYQVAVSYQDTRVLYAMRADPFNLYGGY